jgi:hypothetical protein
LIFVGFLRIVANLQTSMNEKIKIEVYGKADDEICSGCEGHDCGGCAPGTRRRTPELVDEFSVLLAESELGGRYAVTFVESTPENIARNPDVERLLSMASLEPVICIGGRIVYLGGFSPDGLLLELRKKQ